MYDGYVDSYVDEETIVTLCRHGARHVCVSLCLCARRIYRHVHAHTNVRRCTHMYSLLKFYKAVSWWLYALFTVHSDHQDA